MEMSALLILVGGSLLPIIELLRVVAVLQHRTSWVMIVVLLVLVGAEGLVLWATVLAQKGERQMAYVAVGLATAIAVALFALAAALSSSIASHWH